MEVEYTDEVKVKRLKGQSIDWQMCDEFEEIPATELTMDMLRDAMLKIGEDEHGSRI